MDFPIDTYDFNVTPVFRYIRISAEVAGIYLHQGDSKEILQLYTSEDAFKNGDSYFSAIQYEGSNNYEKKEPEHVSWRFKRRNTPAELLPALEAIEAFRQDKNDGPPVNPEAESLSFTFNDLDIAAKATIKQIRAILENHFDRGSASIGIQS